MIEARVRIRIAAGALVSLGVVVAGSPSGAAHAANSPRVLQAEYFEDLEDGRRYNVSATVRGKAESVVARLAGRRTEGRLSRQITDTKPRGKVWFFRQRAFVKAVRNKLEGEGSAKLMITAKGGGDVSRVRCRLEFEPDPMFGDHAGGDCRPLR